VDLFFYDEVAGGAGLCTEIFTPVHAEKLRRAVENAAARLDGEVCSTEHGCDRACIGCLLDFRNRDDHDHMDRRHGLRLLRWMMNEHDLPSVENGGNGGTPDMSSLEHLVSMLQLREGYSAIVQEGIVEIRDATGTCTFRLRPIASYLIPEVDPVLSRLDPDGYRFPSLNLNGGPRRDFDLTMRGKSVVYALPMDAFRTETVALEHRIFGPRPVDNPWDD